MYALMFMIGGLFARVLFRKRLGPSASEYVTNAEDGGSQDRLVGECEMGAWGGTRGDGIDSGRGMTLEAVGRVALFILAGAGQSVGGRLEAS